MVEGFSAGTLATFRYCCFGGDFPVWSSRGFRLMMVDKQKLFHPIGQSLAFVSGSYTRVCRDVRTEAGWPFQKSEQGFDATSERSDTANDDILMFFFQLDLATRVQYALNLEQYEIAKQLRSKLTEVEEQVIKQQEARRGSASKSEAQDMAISILRLRADLQNAVESENYGLAAELRDEISKLEAESLAASVRAQAHENAKYAFRLGQKIRHKAFVAEENLLAPDKPDMGRFDHPYVSFLFYGMDAAGDFIPIKQLREKYNRPRHEVPNDSQDEQN